MEKRKPVTEEDLLLTELMIARSYGNLKQSVARASSRTFSSVGGTIRQHPVATTGAAVGAGVLLYGLFRLMTRGNPVGGKGSGGREQPPRPDMTMKILSMAMPIVTPYLTAYLERYMGRAFSKGRN